MGEQEKWKMNGWWLGGVRAEGERGDMKLNNARAKCVREEEVDEMERGAEKSDRGRESVASEEGEREEKPESKGTSLTC